MIPTTLVDNGASPSCVREPLAAAARDLATRDTGFERTRFLERVTPAPIEGEYEAMPPAKSVNKAHGKYS